MLLFPTDFTEIKLLLQHHQPRNFHQQHWKFLFHSLLPNNNYSGLHLEMLSTVIKVFTAFFPSVFSEYFLLPFLALWFAMSLFSVVSFGIVLFPCFLLLVVLGPASGKVLIILGDTFINPADVPTSLLWKVHCLVLLSDYKVCQGCRRIGIHLQKYFHFLFAACPTNRH